MHHEWSRTYVRVEENATQGEGSASTRRETDTHDQEAFDRVPLITDGRILRHREGISALLSTRNTQNSSRNLCEGPTRCDDPRNSGWEADWIPRIYVSPVLVGHVRVRLRRLLHGSRVSVHCACPQLRQASSTVPHQQGPTCIMGSWSGTAPRRDTTKRTQGDTWSR